MDLPRALAFSRYAERALAAQPDLAAVIDAAVAGPFQWAAPEASLAAPADAAALGRLLRALRRRVFLHTLVRDLTGRAALPEVCAAQTRLADVALAAATTFHAAELTAAHGAPIGAETGTEQALIVVGMGKLGGAELNVSSDIDLVFVYPEEGDTAGPRPISNREYFDRLGRRVITTLNDVTADGYVFRVDMRLRPYGDSGPLTTSFASLENYLVTQGRAWERYAWLKARAITGTRHDDLFALVAPFVYRKYLDYDAYEGLRDIHRQIRDQGARRDYAENVKLGDGGIREIEFIAQALQIVRGGREQDLRIRGTLPALAALGARGLLPPSSVGALSDAYVFLRNVEHRLQYRDDRQTHQLPQDASERALLAEAMDAAPAAFETVLARHRATVSVTFAQTLGDDGRATDAADAAFTTLWEEPALTPDLKERLHARGFADPDALAASLARVKGSTRYAQLPANSRTRFDALVPQLLAVACAHPGLSGAQVVFERLLALLETIARRSAYLALVIEHPPLAAAAREPDGRVRVGGRLPDAAPAPARRAARRAHALRRPRLGRVARRAGAAAARAPRGRRAPDGRAAPLPARAGVPAARAGPGRKADRRTAGGPPVRARGHRARRRAAGVLGAHGGRGRPAAAVRDRRLRQAGRQGTGLRVRPRPRVPVRHRRRRSGRRHAGSPRDAPGPAAQHVADQHDRRGAALRHRPAAAPRRREGAARVEPALVPEVPARARVDMGAPGAHARALRRRGCAGGRGVRGGARCDPAPSPRRRGARGRRRRDAPQDAGRPSEHDAALRPQARRGRHGRHRVRRAVPRARRTRTGTRS